MSQRHPANEDGTNQQATEGTPKPTKTTENAWAKDQPGKRKQARNLPNEAVRRRAVAEMSQRHPANEDGTNQQATEGTPKPTKTTENAWAKDQPGKRKQAR
ncbi:hypothetical protein QE152_g8868 [Popillia japonica]|uniref:Uncharacterized protein n=1 Tax=Popillia japonica TaxID=7064 RepID=A0AAW1LWV7_POPJA